jgi:hypothetical protein
MHQIDTGAPEASATNCKQNTRPRRKLVPMFGEPPFVILADLGRGFEESSPSALPLETEHRRKVPKVADV